MNAIEAYRYAQSNPEAAAQAQEAMQALLSRSATDADFRSRLLTDARSAVAEFTGRDVPEGFNVRFIENTADATIVLPDAVDANAELSEEELEAVAGGTDLIFWGGVGLGLTIVAGGAVIIAAVKS